MDYQLCWETWLATKTPIIQDLARKYPIGSKFHHEREIYHLLGYAETSEGPGLLISRIDPSEDYDAAIAEKEFLCADCL